ncbi:MAG: hypothetical protein A2Y23_01505 [Clostridiales bacterium GWB2_37_7]|nr:MAG: hypothetical protein A2Y23_01505 [Clostridiales bacterium GWB2_37_7]
MLVDLHCHILPGIDDGAKDLNTTLAMCQIAEQDGTDSIIATPHFIHGAINNHRELIHSKVIELNSYIREQNINIELYPGCEAFICPELPKMVREGHVCTLNNTQYILIELPMASVPEYTIDVIYKLKLDGYIPIIAHPERNAVIAHKPNILLDLINRGALTQVNATSVKGLFGKEVMSTAIDLIQHKMVHFLASDAHTTGGRSPKLSSAMSIIDSKVSLETLETIISNSQAVLKGEPIMIEEPIKIKEIKGLNIFGNLLKIVTGINR